MSEWLSSKEVLLEAALVLSLLGVVAMQAWAEEKQDAVTGQERTARIQELQRERARVERELRQLRAQPEGTARSTVSRSELSDQPTRSMKESLESVPSVSARQGIGGRDVQFSIRGSK